MKRVTCSLVIVMAAALFAIAQGRTIVNDQAAAKMLLGKHKLSLQWISWQHFGSATVTNEAAVQHSRIAEKPRQQRSAHHRRNHRVDRC